MLDIQEIDNTIAQLEAEDTTFATCSKLADLYIVRQNYMPTDTVVKEYSDIRSVYDEFKEIKRDYQLGNKSYEAVTKAMSRLCKEVKEFLLILYSNSDSVEERDAILSTIHSTLNELTAE